MIKLPPNHYCVIKNPVVRDEDGEIVTIHSDYLVVNKIYRLTVSMVNLRCDLRSWR